MSLPAGTRLGSYAVLAPLGSGGMSEVYRARDERLGRDVALKVLPDALALSPDLRARFEREARAVAALSHPNVLTIFDFGAVDGRAYSVMELLDGETLHERLIGGPIPLRKALEYAAGIARGLAAAHEKGIVHRDLKPENVFVTKDGRVKVLDFGLARLALEGTRQDSEEQTRAGHTDPGTVLGTAAYMAPEQVRGETADPRTDIFALGCVLYEMLAGRRLFQRGTSVETMSAILRDDVPVVSMLAGGLPPAVERIIRRCLEKNPAERFQSASDLAFHLDGALGEPTGARPMLGPTPHPARRVRVPLAAAAGAAALALGLAAGFLAGRVGQGTGTGEAEPTFSRLTYGRGMIRSARFAPDAKTVIYGAAWDGQPTRLFLARTESPESTPLALPNAEILSVSPTGELLLSLGHAYEGWMGQGTLARAQLLSGSARPMIETVREADWTPDGSDFALVRRVEGRERLEFPPGTPLVATAGYVSHARFSPGGDRLAFAEHPLHADDVGFVTVVDRNGARKRLTGFWGAGVRSLAWSASGDEVLFTASRTGENAALRAVDLDGRQRHLLGGLSHMLVFDAARDGRLLLGRETYLRSVEALTAGASRPRDFSLAREGSVGKYISADGRLLLITDQYAENYATYLRRSTESEPVRLGEGEAVDLSPDGRWVFSVTPDSPSRLLLHPTGPGPTREIPNPQQLIVENGRWLPDGRRLVVVAQSDASRTRGYVIDLDGGPVRTFTPEGIEAVRWWTLPLSRDGSRLVARGPDGRIAAFPVNGGPPESIPGLAESDVPLQWADDPGALFVGRLEGGSWRVRRVDVKTGSAVPWLDVTPPEVAGLRVSQLLLSPDGRYYVHSFSRLLTDLYVVEGVK